MNRKTLALAGSIAAVLILGTVAFAVAEAARAPRDSQIPTVVTSQPAASIVASHVATPAPAPPSVTTKTLEVRPIAPEKNSSSQQRPRTTSTASQREVVTPKVRDNGERSSGDNGSDEHGSSGGSGSGSKKSDSSSSRSSVEMASSNSRRKSDQNRSKNTHSANRHSQERTARSVSVERKP